MYRSTLAAVHHHQRERGGTTAPVCCPPAAVTGIGRVIDIVFEEDDGLAGVLLGKLVYCRTGSNRNPSGGAHERFKDHQPVLAQGIDRGRTRSRRCRLQRAAECQNEQQERKTPHQIPHRTSILTLSLRRPPPRRHRFLRRTEPPFALARVDHRLAVVPLAGRMKKQTAAALAVG